MIGLKICLVNCSTWSFVSSAAASCFLLQCMFQLLVLFVDSVDVSEEVRGRVYDTVGVTECTKHQDRVPGKICCHFLVLKASLQ